MNRDCWSKKIEEDLILLIKDWLRQTGRTQSELCQSLNLPSARLPILVDFLKKNFISGGIPKIANRLCEVEELWTKGGGEKIKKNLIQGSYLFSLFHHLSIPVQLHKVDLLFLEFHQR